MATYYGDNYNNAYMLTKTPKNYPPGEKNGDLMIIKDKITTMIAIVAIGEKVYLGKIPKGATPVFAGVNGPSLGTTGIFTVGTAADEDGILTSVDLGGQAVYGGSPGALMGKKFTDETDVYAIFTEATTAANAKTVEFWLGYILV